ncbi:hypothetical protein G210_1570 [Candida maltosa Xu316]|uniref:Uncharacterized protein n=1 Tax=Candida maltosa (strain Xu316) TaxID=1245528 RepID=M3JY99_CANMX|nr:hypothetical protein G210_1570 [Candida maltosa Xu316]
MPTSHRLPDNLIHQQIIIIITRQQGLNVGVYKQEWSLDTHRQLAIIGKHINVKWSMQAEKSSPQHLPNPNIFLLHVSDPITSGVHDDDVVDGVLWGDYAIGVGGDVEGVVGVGVEIVRVWMWSTLLLILLLFLESFDFFGGDFFGDSCSIKGTVVGEAWRLVCGCCCYGPELWGYPSQKKVPYAN